MSRKTAREKAFRLVFQSSFYEPGDQIKALSQFYSENSVNQDDETYITCVVNGVYENASEIDSLIASCLENWSAERTGKVDMALIRVCVYEMLKMKDIPTGVSINEAIELAKLYGTDDSPAFINGVLGGVNKKLETASEGTV